MTGGRKQRGRRTRQRRIVVRAVRRDPVDVRKLSRALIALAQAKAEAEAQATHDRDAREDPGPRP
jgi:hypothetical protein